MALERNGTEQTVQLAVQVGGGRHRLRRQIRQVQAVIADGTVRLDLGVGEIRGDIVLYRSFFEAASHDPAEFDKDPTRAYNVGLKYKFD